MGITTSQTITRYYDQYRDTEIAFSKDIIRALNLDPRQVYIKCNGGQWPCIINSTSFQLARIIIGTKGGAYTQLAGKEAPLCNIRFCFNPPGSEMVTFMVAGKVTQIAPYMNSQDLAIVTLTFTQRPPDDLIETVGQLLEANQNAMRRREERILLNEENKRKLSLTREETIIMIQNVPRHCILRDLSFAGAKVILLGLSQFLAGKEIILRIDFDDPNETVSIRGIIVSADLIQGRKDICAASIQFVESQVPLAYKLHINNFLMSVRKSQLSASDQLAAQKAAIQAKAAAAGDGAAHSQQTQAKEGEAKPAEGEAKPAAEGLQASAQSAQAESKPGADAAQNAAEQKPEGSDAAQKPAAEAQKEAASAPEGTAADAGKPTEGKSAPNPAAN